MRRPATPRFRYDRPPSRVSDATRADALQLRQAAQPRERHRQGRRAAGAEGVAPASGRGAGCHSGRGRGIGERGGLLAADLRDGRGEAEYSLPPWHRAHPHFPSGSARPPVHQAQATRGAYLSSSHWSLVRVARGQARLVAPSGPTQLFLREGRGGSEELSGVAVRRVAGRQGM